MRFEWDEAKNQANIRKHGIDFNDAAALFSSALLVASDARRDYGEERFHGVGLLHGRVVVVVFTQRTPETIRLISLRKASRRERKQYETRIQN